MDAGPARQPILDALVELVGATGYAQLTVDDVVEAAGVTREAFDACFPDLEAAMLAALDGGANRALDRVRRAAATAAREVPGGRPDEHVERVFEPALRAVLECAAAAPAMTRLCLVEVTTIGTRGLARRDAVLERFVQLLEMMLPDLPGRPSQLASEMVVGGIHELVQRRARLDDTAGLPTLAPALAAIWLPMLTGSR